MAVEDLTKPTFHDDINADIATRSSSAIVVSHYHNSAERIAGFVDSRQEKLDQAHSAVGRLAVKTGLFIPRQRVVEGFRQATQVGLFHVYNQRQGTFYSGLLERFVPEQWASVPPLSNVSEMTEDEASELESLRSYQTEHFGDEPQFDLEIETLRTARVGRVAKAMIEAPDQVSKMKQPRISSFRPQPVYYDLVYNFYQDEAPRHDIEPVQFDPQAFRS